MIKYKNERKKNKFVERKWKINIAEIYKIKKYIFIILSEKVICNLSSSFYNYYIKQY